MYVNLKEKPLERWLIERYLDRECTFVSGVRRHESTTRMENVDVSGRQTYLGATTISPNQKPRGYLSSPQLGESRVSTEWTSRFLNFLLTLSDPDEA